MGTNTTKPYKIQEENGDRRVGITAVDLQDLRRKAVKRLNISEDYIACLDDGTEVLNDEYFKRLPPQTCFTFFSPDESPKNNLKTDLLELQKLTQRLSAKLAEPENKLMDEVREFLCGDNSEIVNRALLDYINSLQSKIVEETREKDEVWFEGLHKKYRTKEAVMKAGAQTRIRNYYQKAREYLFEQNSGPVVSNVLGCLHNELRANEYHGKYFIRSACDEDRICDENGWFRCEGKFNNNMCTESHSINPYGSKEARIVFSTWNLDHVIEKSREVLPTLLKVAESCPKDSEVNWQYFYDLLFTRKNLKLVHIACHKMGVHVGKKCDKNKFYKRRRKKATKAKQRSKNWRLRSRK